MMLTKRVRRSSRASMKARISDSGRAKLSGMLLWNSYRAVEGSATARMAGSVGLKVRGERASGFLRQGRRLDIFRTWRVS